MSVPRAAAGDRGRGRRSTRATLRGRAGERRRGAASTRRSVWIFDLDNTLYPGRVQPVRPGRPAHGRVHRPASSACPTPTRAICRRATTAQFGTTLSGLMLVHKMDPQAVPRLRARHRSVGGARAPELAAAIERLPGRKLIYTNGSRRHAERVAGSSACCICSRASSTSRTASSLPKPRPGLQPHDRPARRRPRRGGHVRGHAAQPRGAACARHDDRARAFDYLDHPVQQEIRKWTEPPEHIHHVRIT